MTLEGPFRDLLEYLAGHPLWPLGHVAAVLGQDREEMVLRLRVAERAGWVAAERSCCGREDRYSVTEAGLAVLEARITGEVDRAVDPLRELA